jgi:hypothetical protein
MNRPRPHPPTDTCTYRHTSPCSSGGQRCPAFLAHLARAAEADRLGLSGSSGGAGAVARQATRYGAGQAPAKGKGKGKAKGPGKAVSAVAAEIQALVDEGARRGMWHPGGMPAAA